MRSSDHDLMPRTAEAIVPLRAVPMLYAGVFKPLCDKILVLICLPIFLPVIAVLFLALMANGGSPFFGHTRVGRDGRKFRCWKIRSMVMNGQAVLERHLAENPAAAAEWEADVKLTRDPRVTKLGAFLRTSSLDELPQIFNVLKGEMSFVGPRPVTEAELERYRGYERAYFSMRPGITGLWQVSARNDVDYASRVRMDVDYASRVSFFGDMSIILRTVGVVLKRTGK